MSTQRPPLEVARRCLCLELMHQRYVLEMDEDAAPERERTRALWASRVTDLGIADSLLEEERALLDRPVGSLDEDALDDVHGRATGALVLLWALGRLSTRPSFESVEGMDDVLSESGLLGDGSIAKARTGAETATLRAAEELDTARGAYLKTRGKAKEVTDPNRIFAEVAAHHLEWALDPEMAFDDDLSES